MNYDTIEAGPELDAAIDAAQSSPVTPRWTTDSDLYRWIK